MNPEEIRALTFDVFGTVVDWRGSLIREGEAFGRAHGLQVDWVRFADAWRGLYQPMLERVAQRQPAVDEAGTTCIAWRSTRSSPSSA
jgi:FMN phosphatase YigB (HAD superfamily)